MDYCNLALIVKAKKNFLVYQLWVRCYTLVVPAPLKRKAVLKLDTAAGVYLLRQSLIGSHLTLIDAFI